MSESNRMKSGPPASAPAAPGAVPGAASFLKPMRRVLTLTGLGLAVLLPVGTVVGWAFGGSEVGLAILLGLAVPAAFFGATVLTGVLATRLDNTRFVGVVVGAWLVKIIVLMVIMALIADAEFYDRMAFFIAFVVGVVAWLSAELVIVVRSKVPYVDVPERADVPERSASTDASPEASDEPAPARNGESRGV
ncbi:hypothetical protein G1H11_22730 [Phytoactinopolyspora alkaliphila]|uniref:Uncharacterized protein n=1 Tax=Phytoactinopolyspora alkaliphila TaxID=1783498 RepID=A0A6N9YTH6_9ACTN|nr:hypothetical protein [Phytoactinopolyspora alkaliphila]NED98119.1 hypothetical protein [Phytoactinopolyspora alkaliphila]